MGCLALLQEILLTQGMIQAGSLSLELPGKTQTYTVLYVNRKMLSSRKKSYDKPRQHIKKQRHHFANKDPYSQSYGFSSSHVLDVRVGP